MQLLITKRGKLVEHLSGFEAPGLAFQFFDSREEIVLDDFFGFLEASFGYMMSL
jgi:hypothetical protein